MQKKSKIDPQEDVRLFKNPLLFYIKNHPRPFVFGMIFLFITNFLDAMYPLIMKMALDQIEAHVDLNQITKTCLIFFAIMFSLAVTRYGWRAQFGKFHSTVAEHLRQKMFRHATTLGPNFFQRNPVGEIMSLMTNDVQSFRQAVGPGLLIFSDGVIILVIILPIMISMNWSWTWKCLILLPLVPILIWKVMSLIHQNYKVLQERFSELTGVVQESIGGIRVIKGFAQEDQRIDLFNRVSLSFEKACNKVAEIEALFIPVMEFGVTSGSVILLFVAKDDLFSGAVTVGTFVAFHRYIQKMVWPMTALGLGLSNLQKGIASFDRIKEFLKTETDIPDKGTVELKQFESLEFRNVSFKYFGSEHYALKNISFHLAAGQSLGIMGPVGSGKTTLLNLLLRLYPLSEGEILVNNIPIDKITAASLRQILLLVPQEAFLFSESLRENISFGLQEAPPNELIEKMADIVDLTGEINTLPHRFESQLGERGVNLSGGQKQRLTIARGLILTAPVLVLDDALSAVDTKTEIAIEEEIAKSTHSKSRIIVAHRLSSLKTVDRLLILRDGEVEALGTSEDVLKISPTFQKIVEIQGQELIHE